MDPKLDTEIQFYRQILTYHQAHPLLPLSDTNDTATLYAIQDSQICGYVLFAYSGRIHYDRPNVMHVNLYGTSLAIRQLLFDGMLRFLSKNLIKFFAFPLARQFWFPMPDVWELEVFFCRIGQCRPKEWVPLMTRRDSTRHYVNLDFFYCIKEEGTIWPNEIPFVFP